MILTDKEINYLPIEHLANLLQEGVYIGTHNFYEATKINNEGCCSSCGDEIEENKYSSLCGRCYRIYNKAKRFDIAFEDVERFEQLNVCMCCGRSGDGADGQKRVAIDHDHITGEVRGTLCFNCNSSIGKLGDNVEGLIKAIQYLSRGANNNYNLFAEKELSIFDKYLVNKLTLSS